MAVIHLAGVLEMPVRGPTLENYPWDAEANHQAIQYFVGVHWVLGVWLPRDPEAPTLRVVLLRA